jgi:group II intron reverse transcriptase/maturase
LIAQDQAFWNGTKDCITDLHNGGYHPTPVRRVFIPKPGKSEKRPIGVPTVYDRTLQRATAKVLESVYEQDFLATSFGGRPGKSAHQAVSKLRHTIGSHKVSWVFEADLKNLFGSLDHSWLMTFLRHRVTDRRVLTLIRRWLKAGVMNQDVFEESEAGTPQGGSMSPQTQWIHFGVGWDNMFHVDFLLFRVYRNLFYDKLYDLSAIFKCA